MKNIAQRVIERRSAKGWSQSALARAVHKKPQNIQQLEDGKVSNPSYILELAEALDCDPYWLKHGEAMKPHIDAKLLCRAMAVVDRLIEEEMPQAEPNLRAQLIAEIYRHAMHKSDDELERDALRLLVRTIRGDCGS